MAVVCLTFTLLLHLIFLIYLLLPGDLNFFSLQIECGKVGSSLVWGDCAREFDVSVIVLTVFAVCLCHMFSAFADCRLIYSLQMWMAHLFLWSFSQFCHIYLVLKTV